jgi:hypothetical protein
MKNWRIHHYLLLIMAVATALLLTTCVWFTTAIGDIDRLFYRDDSDVVLGHIELNGQKVSDRESMKYLTYSVTQGRQLGYSGRTEVIEGVEGFVSQRFVYASIKYFGDPDAPLIGVSTGGETWYVKLKLGQDCPTPLRELFERNQPRASVRRSPAP